MNSDLIQFGIVKHHHLRQPNEDDESSLIIGINNGQTEETDLSGSLLMA